jgi:hypothetical protein
MNRSFYFTLEDEDSLIPVDCHIFSEIHGVLGLDFFKGYKFCIDMTDFEITVHRKVKNKNTPPQ